MKKSLLVSMFLVVGMFVLMSGFVLAVNGANVVTSINSSTAQATAADSEVAIAGNVTEVTIFGKSTTQTWQGYFGNVSGTIELANSAGNVMYNWSSASPSGEVLASTDSNVDWTNVVCASLANMATLETAFNIEATAVDGLDETFAGIHPTLTLASQTLNNCNSTNLFDEQGIASTDFREVLLWDGDAAVFASILNQDVLGFDNRQHDFEMLVLEDGHTGNTATTDYYFYVELE